MEIAVNTAQGIAQVPARRMGELMEAFIGAQDVKPSSRASYRRTLRQYFNWVEEKGYSLSEITRNELLKYKEGLLASGLTSLTVASYITSLRKFYEWAESCKYYPNVAKGIKLPRRTQQFKKQPITTKQATELLKYYQERALRDYAVINLLLRTGLRTIEVTRANIEDITFKSSQRVLIIQGKGRDEKDNFVILTDKAFAPIQKYLTTRGILKGQEPLFSSKSNNSKGERLTTRSVSRIAKEGLKAVGLSDKAYSAHSLRHTTAVNILRAGGTLEQAQFTLRHSSLSTTQIYTATLNEERRLQNSGEALIDGLY